MKKIPDIVKKNIDIEHIMHASCKFGYHYAGVRNSHKIFSLLVSADIHHDEVRLKRSVDYLNYYECLDGAICLGDIMAENFAEDDGSWYNDVISSSKKPYLTVIGNHDMGNSDIVSISATRNEAYEKFVKPTEKKMGIESTGKSYFVKDFDKYKVSLLVLSNYDMPDDIIDGEKFSLHRAKRIFSQEQLNWIYQALLNIPTDHTLIIAFHTLPFLSVTEESVFTQKNPEESAPGLTCYGDENIITDLVDAWVKGDVKEIEYKPLDEYKELLPTLKLNADFRARGKGDFACYIGGHTHEDLILHSKKYPEQKAILFPSSSADYWQNYCSDLPRAEGTKSEDCLTVLSLETNKREIRLVRVGSNFTMDMKERTYFVINY